MENPQTTPDNDVVATSNYAEDVFDFNKPKRRKYDYAAAEAVRRAYLILAIRVGIAIVAGVIALWLYILLDNFISHQQYQRINRAVLLVI